MFSFFLPSFLFSFFPFSFFLYMQLYYLVWIKINVLNARLKSKRRRIRKRREKRKRRRQRRRSRKRKTSKRRKNRAKRKGKAREEEKVLFRLQQIHSLGRIFKFSQDRSGYRPHLTVFVMPWLPPANEQLWRQKGSSTALPAGHPLLNITYGVDSLWSGAIIFCPFCHYSGINFEWMTSHIYLSH